MAPKASLIRTEAKLDELMKALMDPEDLKKAKSRTENLSKDPVPFNLETKPEASTSPVPAVQPIFEATPPGPKLKDKSTSPLPKTPVDTLPSNAANRLGDVEPVRGYNSMTQGEVLKMVRTIKTVEERDRVLDFERKHQNRESIIHALVNWNS